MNKEEFHKLKPEDQRVLIAKDVIERVMDNRFVSKRNRWLVPTPASWEMDEYSLSLSLSLIPDSINLLYSEGRIGQELQPLLLSSTCCVCGVGALFASLVCMYDDLKITSSHTLNGLRSSDLVSKLRAYFPMDQLMLIESAFEEGGGHWSSSDYLRYHNDSIRHREIWKAAVNYCDNCYSDQRSMLRIMHNIIDNNGTFDPLKS